MFGTLFNCDHYIPVAALNQFQSQLDNGLLFSILICPLSQLGQDIWDQTLWPRESLPTLLNTILTPDSATIEVHDHRKSKLNTFTITKTCKAVRARFDMSIKDRGPAWSFLEVKDYLIGFKGPKPLGLEAAFDVGNLKIILSKAKIELFNAITCQVGGSMAFGIRSKMWIRGSC